MDIILTRKVFTEKSTTGELILPGGVFFHTLEDKDRGLVAGMPLSQIINLKKAEITAIPYGRYELALTYSNRFKRLLPLLLDVPGFSGVRIHNGNSHDHTEGCILLGKTVAPDFVGDSRTATGEFMKWFTSTIKKDKIFIEIVKQPIA